MAYQAGPANGRYGTLPPSYGMQDPNYGAFASYEKGSMHSNRLALPKRSSVSHTTMGIILPWGVFAAIFSLVSLPIHYDNAKLVLVLIFVIAAMILAIGGKALMEYRKGDVNEAKWSMFTFLACTLALIVAMAFGEQNYQNNIVPFLDIINLNTYPSVNPTTTHGQLLMDAGIMRFVEGSELALNKSVGFKNVDYYCVAPVTTHTYLHSQREFDFWAVGVNCCSGRGDFHCGDVAPNTERMSGLRLMREEQRGFFRLAVEEAEAAYGIKARHAIFLHWMRDPLVEIDSYHASGYQYLVIGLLAFLAWQVCATVAAALVLHKSST